MSLHIIIFIYNLCICIDKYIYLFHNSCAQVTPNKLISKGLVEFSTFLKLVLWRF